MASFESRIKEVRRGKKALENVNEVLDKQTGTRWIHVAMERNDKRLLDLLLGSELDVNATTSETLQSGAMLGLLHGNFELVLHLVANSQVDACAQSKDGTTLLLYLCRSRVLAKKDKQKDEQNDEQNNNVYERLLELILERSDDVNVANSLGELPLHAAVLRGRRYACKRLVESGAKVDVLTSSGDTALMLAVRAMASEELVKTLLDAGASVSSQMVEFADASGQSAVHKLLVDAQKSGANAGARTLRRRLSAHFTRSRSLRSDSDDMSADVSVPLASSSSKSKSKSKQKLKKSGGGGGGSGLSAKAKGSRLQREQIAKKEREGAAAAELEERRRLKKLLREKEKRKHRLQADANLALPTLAADLPEPPAECVALVSRDVQSPLSTRLSARLLERRADASVLVVDGQVDNIATWLDRLAHRSMLSVERIYFVVDGDDDGDSDSVASLLLPISYLALAMRQLDSKASLTIVTSSSSDSSAPPASSRRVAAHRARQRFLHYCQIQHCQIEL
jgi:Ankyrin repeats (3 copies)